MTKYSWLDSLEYILYWLISSIALGAVCYQLYLFIVFLFIQIVSNPNIRIGSWNSYTTPRFGSFAGFVLGIVWLGGVAYYEYYLRTSKNQERLRGRFFKIMKWSIGLFAGLYLLLLLFSWIV